MMLEARPPPEPDLPQLPRSSSLHAVPSTPADRTGACRFLPHSCSREHPPARLLLPGSLLPGPGQGCRQTSARRLYYYRCIGSDAYRHLKGAVCDNPPVRQDQLDAVVWKELMRLLEDPHI